MSKKKQKGTPTRVVTITQSGNTVWAHVSDAYGREITGTAGAARCHPGDTFDFYEGARIALARAFRQNPFPGVPKKTEPEKPDPENPDFTRGRWVKPVDGRKGEVGDWIVVIDPWGSCGKYNRGDILPIISVTLPDGGRASGVVVRTKCGSPAYVARDEYEIWVPDAAEPKNTKEPPDTFTPSFRVGDIVQLLSGKFVEACRWQVGKISHVVQSRPGHVLYRIRVRSKDGDEMLQVCHETKYRKAPLTLIWREEK